MAAYHAMIVGSAKAYGSVESPRCPVYAFEVTYYAILSSSLQHFRHWQIFASPRQSLLSVD